MSADRQKSGDAPGIRRRAVAFNVALQLGLLAAALVAVNIFAFNNPARIDLVKEQASDLSGPTRSLLRGLRTNVNIHVLLQRNNPLVTEVHNTLKEIAAEGGKRVRVNQISPYADFGAAVDLQRRFKFGLRENIVIVEADDRHIVLGMQDLADFDLTGVPMGKPPRIVSSHVEMAVAGAILNVISGERKRVLYVTGHGEPALDSEEGLAQLATVWKRQNIDLEPVDLRLINEMPGGVAAVILAGPRHDLLPREIDVLRGFIAQKGRLLVFLDWGAKTENLDFFLSGLGITPARDRVLMVRGTGPVVQLYRDVLGLPSEGHPATRRLRGSTVFLRGATQSLKLSRTPATGGGIPKTILEADEEFWGETDQQALNAGNKPELDPLRDNRPPVAVAAAVEMPGPGAETAGRGRPARLAVVGSASCIDPDAITPGVVDFTSSVLNWLIDREGLSGVGPRPPRQFELQLTDEQIGQITGCLLFALPGLAAAAALSTWFIRRR